MTFYKYEDSPTVYQDSDTNAFSNEQQAFGAGVKKDWSNVETRKRNATPVTSQVFSFMDKNQYTADPITGAPTQVTNSSSTVDKAVENLGNNISNAETKKTDWASLLAGLYKTTPSTTAADEANDTARTEYQTLLEKRKQDELARLDAEYNTAKATKEADFTKNTQPLKEKIALLGGAEGEQGLLKRDLQLKMDSYEQSHKLEMDTLFNSRQSMIAQANSSYEDKNFALAEAQLKAAKEAETQMYERQQDYLNILLKLQEEDRAQQTADLAKLKEQKQAQQDAQKFTIENGISQPFYNIGGTVYRSSDGKAYSSREQAALDGVDISNWNNVQKIETGSKAEADYVSSLATKYADTVFPTMTAEQAQKAMQYSRIYKEQVRPPQYTMDTGSKVKLTNDQTNRLLASNLTNTQVQAIQTNLTNGYGIDEILAGFGLNDSQNKAVRDVLGGVSTSQANKVESTYGQISLEPWVWQNYPREDISKAAKKAGFKSTKNTDDAADQYIESLIKLTKPMINSGRSDQDVMDVVINKINEDLK